MQRLSFLACVVIASLSFAASGDALAGRPAVPDEYGTVELLRDRWGVPHVFATTDAGAMYGLGYAAAEDRAFQMYYNLRILQGRLAELIGDVKVGVTPRRPQGRTSALRHDIAMRTIGYFPAAQAAATRLDPPTRQLLEAYAAGVNRYLMQHRADLIDLFDHLGLDPEPWTPAASIASWWRLGLFFSGDGLRELVPYYQIKDGQRRIISATSGQRPRRMRPDDAAAVVQRTDVDDAWVARVTEFAQQHGLAEKIDVTPLRNRASGPRFSHAWVVGGGKTTDGAAVLVSDPQTPVRNPSLLYEFHLSGPSLNARGVGVAGSPVLLIGFTPSVAWGLTALGADQADLFRLKVDSEHPGQYEFDGEWENMEVRTETVRVKGGESRTLKCRSTRFGPVVTRLVAGVRSGDEVALKRIPICQTEQQTVTASFAMLRARDVEGFRAALKGWSFPSANCLFGDRQGNIGYMAIMAYPVRSAAALLGGRAAHEGSTSAADWQGFLPPELLPQMVNPKRGWIVSANHRPIASFYRVPLGTATGSMGDTDRSWRLRERVAGVERFTPADVLDVHYDMVSPVKREIVRLGYHLRDVQHADLEDETLLTLDYLEPWRDRGSKLDMNVPGTEILTIMPIGFRQNFRAARIYGGGNSGLCRMLKTIDQRLADDPQAHLSEEEVEYVDLILRAAWRYGKSRYGATPGAWNRIARRQLREQTLGYFDTLDGFPSLDPQRDVPFPDLQCIDGGTIRSQRSQSYTQFVPLGDVDSAQALLPIGLSENPNNTSYRSGYDLWSQGKLRPAPLSRAKVEALATSRQTL